MRVQKCFMSQQAVQDLSSLKHSRTYALIAALSFVLTLSGCFSTHLSSFEPSQHLEELSQSAAISLPLDVSNPFAGQSRGYQFLLGLLPVSRVFPDSLSDMVTAKLITHAGFNNVGLIRAITTGSPSPPQTPSVRVSITSVSISGYDLLLTRRPSASITLRASLHSNAGAVRECHGSGDYAEFARYAFERELENALEQAADSAARQVIECLLEQPSLIIAHEEVRR
jgi:hypothetical protein